MIDKTYKKYISFFICLVIASVAILPASANSFTFDQAPACAEVMHSATMSMNTDMLMSDTVDAGCAEIEICDADQCSDESCCSLSVGLPVTHETLISPIAFTTPLLFTIVKPPEPPASFDRPPIA